MPYVLAVAVIGALSAACWWRVFRRIGWPPLLSLVTVVPIANLATLVLFAFTRWPIDERLDRLRNGVPEKPGVPAQNFCPHCGQPVERVDNFCRACGRNVSG